MKQTVDIASSPDHPLHAAFGPLTLLPEAVCASRERCYRFGPFCLEVTGPVLLRQGQMVPLPPKAARVLLLLVENAGKLMEKEELLKKAWPSTFTEDGSLTRAICVLRKVLRDGAGGQEHITTISKCGYRFLAPVTRSFTSFGSGTHGRLTLAVLPFANLSGNPKQEHLCDGLTEETTMQLSRLNPQQLSVIARTSAMKYKLTTKSVAEIGEELGAAFLLEGSVRRAGKRVRIAAQLVRVVDQIHVWSESYQGELGDILTLQSDVAQAIARQIETRLMGKPV
jgi:TolB-like protein